MMGRRHPERDEIIAWCLAVLMIAATAFLAWLAMQGDPPEPRGDVRAPGALPAMIPCVREKLPCR